MGSGKIQNELSVEYSLVPQPNPRAKATAVTLGFFVFWARVKNCCNIKVVEVS